MEPMFGRSGFRGVPHHICYTFGIQTILRHFKLREAIWPKSTTQLGQEVVGSKPWYRMTPRERTHKVRHFSFLSAGHVS